MTPAKKPPGKKSGVHKSGIKKPGAHKPGAHKPVVRRSEAEKSRGPKPGEQNSAAQISGAQRSGIRLQKFLAERGLGSRRKIEGWITEGKIRVDGRQAQLGDRVDENSRISIDGRPLRGKHQVRKSRVIIYNKPEGEICSRDDPANRPTVFRHLPKLKGERWVSVGRLDINTRGLLLFTNKGDLANRLMHPEFGLEREYLCRIFGKVDASAVTRLTEGVELDGEMVRFQELKRNRGEGSNTWYSVVVTEGKYREVRRMWESVGCRVSRLMRVRYGATRLPKNLRQGEYLELKEAEVSRLLQSGGESQQTESDVSFTNSRSSKSGSRKPRTGKSDPRKFRTDGVSTRKSTRRANSGKKDAARK
jgi:23S rRNA pseudouridine2605 synthase